VIEFPDGPFDIVLADPPWRYNSRTAHSKFGRGCSGHYPMMSTADIAALPVGDVAAPRATLFLWATWPKLEAAATVMGAWGFRYITVGFLWVKTNPDDGRYFFGPGYYSKANTEPCLLGRRGRPMKPATDMVASLVVSPRREHSRKPEAVRNRIALMYPEARKVELFCREAANGWEAWGNEVKTSAFARQEKLFQGIDMKGEPHGKGQ
jgi:N6-adenosine-specific RNA methylase IME4